MMKLVSRHRSNKGRIVAAIVLFFFSVYSVMTPMALAQTLMLPASQALMHESPSYAPAVIRGLTVDSKDPLHFQFWVDTGRSGLHGQALEKESTRLIKYFMAGLTTPEKELWVNLSPYEKDRIIPDSFGITEMGRDLLTQDYLLKQLTSSLMHPEQALGKKFWERVHERASAQFGSAEVPLNTFNKVWIVPQQAELYQHDGQVIVLSARLKVMLEEDYLALQKNAEAGSPETKVISGVTSAVVREVLIPELEKEVNDGQHFAELRQIYYSMILAAWYKRNLRDSLLGNIYVDRNKTPGVEVADKNDKQKIYDRYVEAFQKGACNYIKEETDPQTGETIARKYFSGGFGLAKDFSQIIKMRTQPLSVAAMGDVGPGVRVDVSLIQSSVSRREFVKLALSFAFGLLSSLFFSRPVSAREAQDSQTFATIRVLLRDAGEITANRGLCLGNRKFFDILKEGEGEKQEEVLAALKTIVADREGADWHQRRWAAAALIWMSKSRAAANAVLQKIDGDNPTPELRAFFEAVWYGDEKLDIVLDEATQNLALLFPMTLDSWGSMDQHTGPTIITAKILDFLNLPAVQDFLNRGGNRESRKVLLDKVLFRMAMESLISHGWNEERGGRPGSSMVSWAAAVAIYPTEDLKGIRAVFNGVTEGLNVRHSPWLDAVATMAGTKIVALFGEGGNGKEELLKKKGPLDLQTVEREANTGFWQTPSDQNAWYAVLFNLFFGEGLRESDQGAWAQFYLVTSAPTLGESKRNFRYLQQNKLLLPGVEAAIRKHYEVKKISFDNVSETVSIDKAQDEDDHFFKMRRGLLLIVPAAMAGLVASSLPSLAETLNSAAINNKVVGALRNARDFDPNRGISLGNEYFVEILELAETNPETLAAVTETLRTVLMDGQQASHVRYWAAAALIRLSASAAEAKKVLTVARRIRGLDRIQLLQAVFIGTWYGDKKLPFNRDDAEFARFLPGKLAAFDGFGDDKTLTTVRATFLNLLEEEKTEQFFMAKGKAANEAAFRIALEILAANGWAWQRQLHEHGRAFFGPIAPWAAVVALYWAQTPGQLQAVFNKATAGLDIDSSPWKPAHAELFGMRMKEMFGTPHQEATAFLAALPHFSRSDVMPLSDKTNSTVKGMYSVLFNKIFGDGQLSMNDEWAAYYFVVMPEMDWESRRNLDFLKKRGLVSDEVLGAISDHFSRLGVNLDKVSPQEDFSQKSVDKAAAVGGINLDPAMMDIQIRRDDHGVPLPWGQQDPAMLMGIQGFSPHINEITVLPHLIAAMGLAAPNK